MKIIDTKVFEGRNIYSHKKCIRMDVDLEGYCEIPSKHIEGFNDNLLKILPELRTHRCGIDETEGFIKRLREGTYMAHICEHIILAVQNILGIDVSYGKSREINDDLYYIVYEYEYEETAVNVGRLAVDVINLLVCNRPLNFEKAMKELHCLLNEETIGASTKALCEEASKLGIPVIKVGDTGLYQFGTGKYGKYIEATICEDTKAIGVDISCDKIMTKKILEMQCLPVARGAKVSNIMSLLLAGTKIGYPVVLKPQYGHQGEGVCVNVKNEKEAILMYTKLSKKYKDILIEKYVEGKDYRVCVIGGEVAAVSQRVAPFITGDGKSTVKHLIDLLNNDSRRGIGHEKSLTKVKINEELIEQINKQGYDLDKILVSGEKLKLRGNANLSTGGIAIDCTDDISEENIYICKRAAKAIGLNICGIDICSESISKSLYEQGAIVEINSAPGIRMHHYPYEGQSRNVAKAIVKMMFNESRNSIPIVAITGTNGKTTTTRLVSHVLSLAGYNVGMTTTSGIFVNGKCIVKGDTTGADSATALLLNRDIDIAVLETARGGIIRCGLGYDLADVGVITNITGDHLGLDGIETIEELAKVKSLVVEAVKKDGYAIINADDHVSKSVLDRIKCKVIAFSKNRSNELVRSIVKRGGIGIYIDEGYMWVEDETSIYNIISTRDIGIALEGKLKYNIENAMTACAVLIGLGVDYFTINKGLGSFYCDEKNNPGRFNVYDLNGATVILDYAHNFEGYKSVLEGIKRLESTRIIGIIGVPGDRLEKDILNVGNISGKYFDYIYVKEDKDRRGRRRGEVAELLEKGILSAGFNKKNLEVILSEEEAMRKALLDLKYGDVIVIFFEDYEPLVEIVKEKVNYLNKKTTENILGKSI